MLIVCLLQRTATRKLCQSGPCPYKTLTYFQHICNRHFTNVVQSCCKIVFRVNTIQRWMLLTFSYGTMCTSIAKAPVALNIPNKCPVATYFVAFDGWLGWVALRLVPRTRYTHPPYTFPVRRRWKAPDKLTEDGMNLFSQLLMLAGFWRSSVYRGNRPIIFIYIIPVRISPTARCPHFSLRGRHRAW